MTLRQYLFEGQTQGTVITTGNTGASEVTLNTGAGIFDSSVKSHGSFGVKITSGLNVNSVIRLPADAANNQMAFSGVLKVPAALDTHDIVLLQFVNSAGARAINLVLLASNDPVHPGYLALVDAANARTMLATTTDFALGGQYRFEFVLTGGSTSAGVVHAKIFTPTGTTAIKSVDLTTANLTTSPIANVLIGIVSTNNVAGVVVGLDDIQLNDGATSAPGIVTDTPAPTLTATLTDNLARITASASAGTSPYAYNISQTAGATTPPIPIGDGDWLVAKHASDTLVYTVSVTDGNNKTTTTTKSVSPVASGSAPTWPKRPTGSLPSSTWA